VKTGKGERLIRSTGRKKKPSRGVDQIGGERREKRKIATISPVRSGAYEKNPTKKKNASLYYLRKGRKSTRSFLYYEILRVKGVPAEGQEKIKSLYKKRGGRGTVSFEEFEIWGSRKGGRRSASDKGVLGSSEGALLCTLNLRLLY